MVIAPHETDVATTLSQLLESGVHFGHETRRWNPKMRRFILTDRNGMNIIDLQQSLAYIDRSYAFIKETVAKGGTIMFVGTKKQAEEAIAEQATRVGMPYVNQRWLGGMLTNFQTMSQRVSRLNELDDVDFETVAGSGRTKKELLLMKREHLRLEKNFGGIRAMRNLPSAVWVVDTNKEHLAVDKARKLRIPIIAILDSNCDPDLVDFPIPGNDDGIRAVGLLTRVVADAVAEGIMSRSGLSAAVPTVQEPLAEWELLAEPAQGPLQAPAQSEVDGWLFRQRPDVWRGLADHDDPRGRVKVASTNEPVTDAVLRAIASVADLQIVRTSEAEDWVLAFRILRDSDDNPATLRVVRRLDQDGADLEVVWAGGSLGMDEVTPLLALQI